MTLPKLTKLELHIMEVRWTRGPCAIREIQEAFPKRNRPAYTTIHTTVYRLETKKTLRRVRKISHAHIFEALVSRSAAQSRLIDDLLALQDEEAKGGSDSGLVQAAQTRPAY
jgi:BlaI family penicillinase repressor